MKRDKEILTQLKLEINKFTKEFPSSEHLLSDSYNDHKKRYEKDLEIIRNNFKGGRVLDIGSSPYHLLYCLKSLGIDAVGIDIDPKQLKGFADRHKLLVKKCDIETEKMPFGNNTFDFIIFTEIFEHLRINPILVLREINRVLKKGGTLFLTTPNLYAIHKIFMFNLGISINDAYNEFNKLEIYGYMGHIREYSTKEIRKFLENTGFKLENVTYQNYYSFFKYAGFKNNILLRLAGLMLDILMRVNPYWRRHQVVIAKK